MSKVPEGSPVSPVSQDNLAMSIIAAMAKTIVDGFRDRHFLIRQKLEFDQKVITSLLVKELHIKY